MRVLLTILLFQLFNTACQSGSTAKEEAKAPAATPAPVAIPVYQMKPDTITIQGRFMPGCNVPGNIRIAIHNVDNSFWKDVPVAKEDGSFTFKHYLTQPRRIALRTIFGVKFDFFATTNEKVYNIEIACENKGAEVFSIKGSTENDAYQPFALANKQLQADLDSFAKKGLDFALVKKAMEEYQAKMADIAAKYPNTFTGQVFAPAEKLPEGSLASMDALRANFLKRDAYANPQIYNDFLPQRILLGYIAIRGKEPKDADQAVQTLMNIGLRNPEAAKSLQEIMSSIFYKMHQEDLVIAYIKWADANPDKMYNPSTKGRLQNLKGIVAGNNMIDFTLPDANGKPRKLSETVNANKLTVLIFYGPNCGHCKEKVPQLFPYWDKYKSKGLGIVAVGSDAKDDEWRAFINTHGKAEWVNHLETETSAHPSNQYYAENPTFILIDGQGKIVSRVYDLDWIKEEIDRRLGK